MVDNDELDGLNVELAINCPGIFAVQCCCVDQHDQHSALYCPSSNPLMRTTRYNEWIE